MFLLPECPAEASTNYPQLRPQCLQLAETWTTLHPNDGGDSGALQQEEQDDSVRMAVESEGQVGLQLPVTIP